MLEQIDGSTIVTLHTDKGGYTWHVLQREGGSMCLYATRDGIGAHWVLYDTLDNEPPAPAAQAMIDRLVSIARVLLAFVA